MKTREQELYANHGLTLEQTKNLVRTNPYLSATLYAYQGTLFKSSDEAPQSSEEKTGFTREQVDNLLKNPEFYAEHQAFKVTLK